MSDIKFVKDMECASCVHIFSCKGKPTVNTNCINYEPRPTKYDEIDRLKHKR